MVKSGPSKTTEFEKVIVDEWINGEIVDVQEFKNVTRDYTDKDTSEKKTRVIDQVRFATQLDGYEFKHYSRKMTNSTNENANLFKFLLQLYPNLAPDSYLNLDKLKGLKIKTMWINVTLKNKKIFQALDKIRALGELPNLTIDPPVENDTVPADPGEEIPF